MEKNSKSVELPVIDSDELKVALITIVSTNKTLRAVVFYLCILLSISVVVSFYLATKEEKADAFGLTKDGRVYPLSRIEGEIFTQARIIAWSKEKSEKLYDFTFRTVEGEWPNNLSTFMLDSAKEEWINSLRTQGYFKDVIDKNGVMYANVEGEPLYRGKNRGEKCKCDVSIVEVPLRVTVDARNSTTDRNREFKVTLQLQIGHVGFKDPRYEGLAIGKIKLAMRR